MITIRYIATVGWPPFLHSTRNTVWPWSQDASLQYYFGVGETVTGLQLLPDFIALLIASLTKRQWWTDQRAAEALLQLTAGFSRIEQDSASSQAMQESENAPDDDSKSGGAGVDSESASLLPGSVRRQDTDSAGDSLDIQVMRRQIKAEFPVLSTEDLDWLCRADATVERQQIRRFRQSALHLYAGEVLAGALSRAFNRQQEAKTERLDKYANRIASALQQAQRTGTDAAFNVKSKKHHHPHRSRSRRFQPRLLNDVGRDGNLEPQSEAAAGTTSAGKGISNGQAASSASAAASVAQGSDSVDTPVGSAAGARSVRTGISSNSGSGQADLTQDLALAQTMASVWDWIQMKIGLLSWNIVILVLFLVASIQSEQNIIIGGYFVFSLWFMYSPEATRSRLASDPMFSGLRWFNMLVIFLQIVYQAPFIPPPEQCSTTSLCFSWQTVIGLQKFRVITINGSDPCLALDSLGDFDDTGPAGGSGRRLTAMDLSEDVDTAAVDGWHEDPASFVDFSSMEVLRDGFSDGDLHQFAHGARSMQANAAPAGNASISSSSDGVSNNGDCPSPFNAQNGILTSFILLILVSMQLQLYQSDSYMSVRAYLSTSQQRAKRRGKVWMEMEADERAHQSRSLARQQKRLRMRLSKLVQKTEKWHNLLSGDIDEGGSSFSPPAPPQDVCADVLPDSSVRVQWTPPKGFRAAEPDQNSGPPSRGLSAAADDTPGLRRDQPDAPEEDEEGDADDDRSSVTNSTGSELSEARGETNDDNV